MVLHLVPRHERGLGGSWVKRLLLCRSRLRLRLRVVRMLHRRRVLLVLFELNALSVAGLICNLALLTSVAKVCGGFNLN